MFGFAANAFFLAMRCSFAWQSAFTMLPIIQAMGCPIRFAFLELLGALPKHRKVCLVRSSIGRISVFMIRFTFGAVSLYDWVQGALAGVRGLQQLLRYWLGIRTVTSQPVLQYGFTFRG